MIPFFNITAENHVFNNSFVKELNLFLKEGQFILGDDVHLFEKEYAAFCGTNYCIGTSNGLDALRLIFEGYKSLGILKEGDEVLVPAHTYIASILAVIQSGMKPVFVEPKINCFGIDPELALACCTPNTKVCLVVHLYGELVDTGAFQELAKSKGLLLIEDAAQAHGAISKNEEKAGAIGDAAAFSFYPTKNIGALGDAGAVTTNNEDLAQTIRKLQNYGSSQKNKHELLGFNMRLDALQARFLRIKLRDYPIAISRRISIARQYAKRIDNSKILLPNTPIDQSHVFHLFVVRVKDRVGFINHLENNEVGYLIHYPTPPHKQEALKEYNSLKLPITEDYHREVVSIPLYPSLSDKEVDHIIRVLNSF